MNVVVVGRDHAPASCVADPRFTELLDAALGNPRMVDLALLAVREYPDANTLANGRGHGHKGLATFVDKQKYGPGERTRGREIVRALRGLYADFDPSHVRGVLLEQLVQQQLRTRYSAAGSICDNNVKIELGPPSDRHSTSHGLDVLGWDGRLGEGHDCKADATSWRGKKQWIDELRDEVAPRGLSVGLVTADSKSVAERKLRRDGIQWGRLVLVHADRLFSLLPLHK